MSEENKPQNGIEEMVETHILETDTSTGLDIRYVSIKVPKREGRYYPKTIYHNLSGDTDKK